MRLAVLADIHGNIRALEAVLADLRRYGPDRIVNLGDCFSGALHAAAVADVLMETGWPTVRGNHDRDMLDVDPEAMREDDRHAFAQLSMREEDWLADLPLTLRLEPDVLLVHGTPASEDEHLMETAQGGNWLAATGAEMEARLGGMAAGLVLCGHSHIPRQSLHPGGGLIVNPGSVGQQASIGRGAKRPFAAGTPHARYAIAESGTSGWRIAFHTVTYDWEATARDAEKAGQPDWAQALRTGQAQRA